jgi:hypothetical protein
VNYNNARKYVSSSGSSNSFKIKRKQVLLDVTSTVSTSSREPVNLEICYTE